MIDDEAYESVLDALEEFDVETSTDNVVSFVSAYDADFLKEADDDVIYDLFNNFMGD